MMQHIRLMLVSTMQLILQADTGQIRIMQLSKLCVQVLYLCQAHVDLHNKAVQRCLCSTLAVTAHFVMTAQGTKYIDCSYVVM